jgi:hypothetical protein
LLSSIFLPCPQGIRSLVCLPCITCSNSLVQCCKY